MENIRVSELAKELGLTSKEVIEKFAQISITVKSHSNVVNSMQVSKLKDFIAGGSKVPSKKPKAFIVKKAKVKHEEETEVVNHTETPATKEAHTVERIQRVVKVEKVVSKAPVVEAPKEIIKETKEPVKKEEELKPKDSDIKRKVEVIKPIQPKSRLEIVKRAPIKRVEINPNRRPNQAPDRQDRGERRFGNNRDNSSRPNNFQRQNNGSRPNVQQQRPSQGQAPAGQRPDRNKKPIERHIISQDIYENKGFSKKRPDNKKKTKDFNSKKEEQEIISLEKAAAQHHKKKTEKEEFIEEIPY